MEMRCGMRVVEIDGGGDDGVCEGLCERDGLKGGWGGKDVGED